MRTTTILTALLVLMAVFTAQSQTAVQPVGSGTSGDPYQIATLNNLYWLSQSDTAWGRNYIQTADINAAGTHNWDISGSDTLGFLPIGVDNTIYFSGSYNGQGHVIDNLFINRPNTDYIGLFASISNAVIDSIGVLDIDITGANYTGGLIGFFNESNIDNCFSSGNIVGNNECGGLIGHCRTSSSGFVSNCYSHASVDANTTVGGLLGKLEGPLAATYPGMDNCYCMGNVLATGTQIGGLIGYIYHATVSNSFWDTQTSGQTTSAGGTGKTTTQMQTLTTYTDSTWDFVGETVNGTNDYWDMSACLNGGYPYSSWQNLTFTTPAGSGTTADPYQIATLADLRWLSENDCVWDKNFIQIADINAAETHNWNISGNDTLGFSPIGYSTTGFSTTFFTGEYNGQGHIIDSLFINRYGSFIGLFGLSEGAHFENIGIINVNIIGHNSEISALCGHCKMSSLINNCYSSGNISGYSTVAGLVGVLESSSSVTNSYSLVNVTGDDKIAGLIATNWGGIVENCYSAGVINGNTNTGGLIGTDGVGGTTTNSFWDTQTSGQITSTGGTGQTTAEMKTLTTYTDSTWDFVGETVNGTNDYWDISCVNGGYPYLSWQTNLSFITPAGNGTTGDPYQINTLADLRWLSENSCVWDKNFIQTADINAADTRNWNVSGSDTLGFSPIGNSTTNFTGSYNGQGHIIDSLFIDISNTHYIGLFGFANGVTIDSLGVTNCDIIASSNLQTGVIVGAIYSSNLRNCYSTGYVTGATYTGGLVGSCQSTEIKNCYINVEVTSTSSYVGGLTGKINNSSIINCYSIGVVNGGSSNVGGLIGGIAYSPITTNSFWNTQTSGQATSAGGTGLTTAQMQTLTTYTDSTWDFVGETANGTNDYWDMNACLNGGYPYLSWQTNLTVPAPMLGTGTTANPYQIATLNDLRWLSENSCVWDKNFIQTADINAAETHNWNISGSDTLGFSPIGNTTTYFTGTYNGQGYFIDSLFINRPLVGYMGLFGFVDNSINNVNFTACQITGSSKVGAIVGRILSGGIVEKSFCSGFVNGNMYVGSVAGYNSGNIINCYSTVNISGNDYVGGLVGTDIEATGSVVNSYSIGSVFGTGTNIGGLIGQLSNGATVTNSFYNTDSTATSAGGTGLTTAQMKQMCVYADSTWDFMLETVNGTNDIWGLNASENGGYPFLSWQGYTHTESCCGYVDLENPTITCVGNQTVSAASNHYYTVVGNEFDPTANNDNCGVASIVNNYNNTNTLVGDSLPEGTTTITWIVTDNYGNVDSCNFDVQVDIFVGINSVSQNGINIYPNPAHNQLIIDNAQFTINNLQVLDITGKVIKQLAIEQSNNLTIEIEDLKQGIYFIKLTTNNSIEILKFVKE